MIHVWCSVCRPVWIQTHPTCARYGGGGDLSIMQCEGECSRRSQWRRGAEPVSAPLRVRVCPTGSRRCQTEEVSGGGEAEEVSVKVSVMERGSLCSAELWGKWGRGGVQGDEEQKAGREQEEWGSGVLSRHSTEVTIREFGQRMKEGEVSEL